jgi:hypothetical protein
MEAGSNLNVFHSEITFENPNNENSYYYAIAKDYEWSFVALHATVKNNDEFHHLTHEKVDKLPSSFNTVNSVSKSLDKLVFFKINLPLDLIPNIDNLVVYEYHKGRREPFPKQIKVYEKQSVELYESKYYLSVYPTKKSEFHMSVKS